MPRFDENGLTESDKILAGIIFLAVVIPVAIITMTLVVIYGR